MPFLRKVEVSGFMAPLGAPMVAPGAWWWCWPPSRLNLPERLEHTGLLVVFRPKVEAVGARLEGYWLLWRLAFSGTYCSLGIRL